MYTKLDREIEDWIQNLFGYAMIALATALGLAIIGGLYALYSVSF